MFLHYIDTDAVTASEKIAVYDSLDADVIQSYLEYSMASLFYYALKEGACSEQSAAPDVSGAPEAGSEWKADAVVGLEGRTAPPDGDGYELLRDEGQD